MSCALSLLWLQACWLIYRYRYRYRSRYRYLFVRSFVSYTRTYHGL